MEFKRIDVAEVEWEPEEGNYTTTRAMFVCERCSATVEDVAIHERWHDRLSMYGIAL